MWATWIKCGVHEVSVGYMDLEWDIRTKCGLLGLSVCGTWIKCGIHGFRVGYSYAVWDHVCSGTKGDGITYDPPFGSPPTKSEE